MTVAATFPDPEVALIEHLNGELLGVASVSPEFPRTTTAVAHVQVELEGSNDDDYPVTERAQVRVTCHVPPGRRSEVKELASLARAHAVSLRSVDVAGVFPAGGRSSVITDPDTRNLMCWFLVRVDLKATLLAS